MTLTVAVETVSPCASRTLPPIAPFVVDWAKAPEANSKATIRAKQNLTMGDCIPRVVIISFFLSLIAGPSRTCARFQQPAGRRGGPPPLENRLQYPPPPTLDT